MHAWPSVAFFLICLFFLLEARAIGGRTTLSVTRILLFFSFGAAGAGILSLVFQRIALGVWHDTTVAWGFGPVIEELMKALPVVLLAYVLRARRRMTIADYAIVAFATGLGFEFTESNLSVLLDHKLPDTAHWWLPLVGHPYGLPGQMYVSAGHAVWTGLVGLGIGIGIRAWPRSPLRFVPAAFGLAFALFEHMAWNWKGTHIDTLFGEIESIGRMPGWAEWLYSVDLHGRLSLVVLPVVLLVATVAEGLWCRRAAAVPAELMLPDEGVQPLVAMEWIALQRATRRGRHEFVRVARYLRRRRELLLAIAELRREPDDPELQRSVQFLRDRVGHEREELSVPLPRRWLPQPGTTTVSVRGIVKRYWPLLLSYALVVLRFAIGPNASGTSWLSARVFALLMIFVSVAFFTWRLRQFRRLPRPTLFSTDGETLVSYHARALLLATSGVTVALSFVVWFLSKHAIAPQTGSFITLRFDDWTAAAGVGGASGLAAVGAITLAALADPTPPDTCGPLESEAGAAADRIDSLETPGWIA